jgi:hypothetical protein
VGHRENVGFKIIISFRNSFIFLAYLIFPGHPFFSEFILPVENKGGAIAMLVEVQSRMSKTKNCSLHPSAFTCLRCRFGRQVLLPFLICSSIFSQPSLKPALALTTTPYFEKPAIGLLPIGFINKLDTCQTDSSIVDSSGTPWFRGRLHERIFWLHAKDMRYIMDIPQDFLSMQVKGDDDKKRRLQILQNKPDWPHRIKMSVRSGQICLDMTEEQLVAAWGEPFQKGTTYTLGIGDHATWLYKSSLDKILIVNLQKGHIIGWTQDK